MLKGLLILILVNLIIWLFIGAICVGCVFYIQFNNNLKNKIDVSEYDQVCEAIPFLEKIIEIGKIITSFSFLIILLVAMVLMIWYVLSTLFSAIKAL